MGFGTQLHSEKIGNVFLIPISSKWTFKAQVIATQLIIGVFAFMLFGLFKYVGTS
jgi:hypothetical protein